MGFLESSLHETARVAGFISMSGSTSIEWTRNQDGSEGKSWNPGRGCSRISPGCDNCYAMKLAYRFKGEGLAYEGLATLRRGKPDWTGIVREMPDAIDAPLRWRKPQRVFVNSQTDLFHHGFSNEFIAAVFGVMAACPQHTFLTLTKRAERMREWFEWVGAPCSPGAGYPLTVQVLERHAQDAGVPVAISSIEWPLPNVHLGVSVESQEYADERIPDLLATPAAVHWISAEPLLGPLDLSRWIAPVSLCLRCSEEHNGVVSGVCPNCKTDSLITLWGEQQLQRARTRQRYGDDGPHDSEDGPQLSWVVPGGESGAGARPYDLAWPRSIIAQCRAAGVPVFHKQLGSRPMQARSPGMHEFTSYQHWVDKARTWMAWHGSSSACVDTKGRICRIGSDFMRARDEGTYPITILDPVDVSKKGGIPEEWDEDLRVREYPSSR